MDANLIALLQHALDAVRHYLVSVPQYEVLMSAERQLVFMNGIVLNGQRPTAEQRDAVNLGLLAVRNLQDADPDLARLLIEADYEFKQAFAK